MHKALKSFSGAISMCEGETREINDAAAVADLLKAGYIEEVKPARRSSGRSAKKSGETNPQE